MEKWVVIGGIWAMTLLCLTLFVRGASPAHSRAVAIARVRNARRNAEAERAERAADEPERS
jgi:hypothetical protein